MRRFILMGAMLMAFARPALAREIEFVEDFSLAGDRAVALRQLIPGTEDFYYYHSLHYLNTEQFGKVAELQAPWVQRHGETQRVWEIRTRSALLTYEKNPAATLAYLRNRFGIHFPHQKEELNAEPNFPTALDAALISRQQFIARANGSNPDSLDGYEDSALDWLTRAALNANQRRSLLSRLTRPDYDTLTKLVLDDLAYENSGGFGSLPIHRQLLLSQMESLLKTQPNLLNQQQFVVPTLIKLQPGADEDWRNDPARLEAWLDRLEAFAARLSAVHNSLKAHVLYHRLALDRQRGTFNKARFLAYLQLPRQVHYASKAMVESVAYRQFPTDLNTNYEGATLLPAIGNDEPLVRSYLQQFFLEATTTKEFEPFINDIYLRHLFAETKIVNGLGEAEQWASLLPPELYQQLKQRVDIDFAFTNQTQFGAAAPVTLDLDVKNVSTLIVKVFEINTKNYYRTQQREVDTDINLDGLVPNFEQTFNYAEPALRRTRRHFEFPQLNKAGVYIVDFIGNGRSSRALIRKGRLRQLVRTAPAGQVFTILDENNQQVKNATLWLAGHEYAAGENGLIIVPFSANPGRQSVVISVPMHERVAGAANVPASFSVLDHFQHEAENYGVTAGFYVDRESLLRRQTAEVIVRPGLLLNGTLVSLKLLEDVKLTIASVDLDGTPSSQDVADFKVFEDRESTHEFQVPQRLASITFTLTATVKKLSAGGQKVTFAAFDTFTLNDIDKTEKVEDLYLMKTAAGYLLELRGKTGEPRASRPVVFNFKHRDFRAPVGTVLKTDPAGRIALGDLRDISSFTVVGPEATSHAWTLLDDRHSYSQLLHGRAGQTLSLPFLPRILTAKPDLREELSLLELRGDVDVSDRFEHLRVQDGLVVIEKLPAGDYDLLLKSTGARIRIRIAAGEQIGRYVVGSKRQLETKPLPALQIASAVVGEGKNSEGKPAEMLRVSLKNVSKLTRLHVFATRFVPEYDPFGRLGRIRDAEPYYFQQTPAQSVYLTGRNIGDEYRYIIDRKYARKFPGNMLERPSLLLNPWAVRETETGEQLAAGGDDYGAVGNAPKSEAASAAPMSPEGQAPTGSFASDFDFLADATAVLVNLLPDEKGVIEIPRAALGAHQQIHLVAVDPLHTTYRSVALPEVKPAFRDLRLLLAFDAKAHFTQQRQISIVPKGQAFTLQDVTTSKFEAFDSLERVYGLYSTLSHDPKLVEFAFILNWPKLKPEEKRVLYSKHASHELSFFLYKKDPEFFQTVVKPHLANKKDKTFVDRFLLEEDLAGFLRPWQYAQLNIMERCLLAQRIQEEKSRTVRHLGDLFAVLPPNIDNFNRLFGTAVLSSSLEVSDPLGLRQVILSGTAEPMMELSDLAAPHPAVAGAPASPPMSMPAGMAAGKPAERKELAKAKADSKARDGRSRRYAADKKMAEKDSDEDMVEESLFDAQALNRQQARQLYRKLDKTWEWAENNYHHLTIDQQTAALVSINAFWHDYAKHEAGQPFLSRNLAEAGRNFPEMLFALSVLDLPFESPKHESKFDGNTMTLTPGGPLVVFHEEIKPTAAPILGEGAAAKVLVSQNFFRHGDRQRVENGETVDKFVSEEFLTHVVYGCQVVITNPTSTRQKLNVLTQIPRGSIAVLNGQPTKSQHLDLEPYHTQTIDYHFYFPAAGQYPHFPVHVARNETLIAAATPLTFNVVNKPTKLDTESWDYVSQYGTTEEVLTYLDKHNLQELNLDKIAWRMHDAKVFEAVTTRLALRHVYQHTLWSYSLLHNSVAAAREFLQHVDPVINDCGGRLNSPLLTIDPVARRTFEFLEYKPLVNARVHALGNRRQLVNDRLHGQYHRFLKELAYAPRLNADDLLAVTYYLLLQDRVEESLATFAQVKAESSATKLQYDYCAAYLSFFTGDHAQARVLAQKHANDPVDRWKNTFNTIIAQLDEAEGGAAKTIDGEDRNQQQAALAATEPNFDFTVDAQRINLNYQNLTTARVNFYEMDVELLFSRNPFVQQFSGQFGSIRPNHSVEVALPKDKLTAAVALPEALRNRNVLVEITAGGQTKSQAFYSHSLLVQVVENYGQVKVTQQQTGKPVAKAYVKVYSQTSDGQVKFYKDGYTDLRGRFDYASLNTSELEVAAKFSILILSEEHGALVREASPPKR